MFRPLSIFQRNEHAPVQSGAVAGDPFYRLQHEMNRLFDDAFGGSGLPAAFRPGEDGARFPKLDVHESDAAIDIEAELPGVNEDDLDVQITDNLLTIRGEKKFERKDEKDGEYKLMERSYGSFSRSMSLPFSVNPDAVEATFRDGVLKLTLPKPSDAVERARKISIKRG